MSGAPAAPGDQRPDGGAQEPTKSGKGKIENPNDDERSTRTYPCRFCEKIFNKPQALGGHMTKHRGLEREIEAYGNAHALVNNYPRSHNLNPCGGAEIGQNPSAPSAMTNPGLALGAWPLDIPPAYSYDQTGLAHFNMPVPSLPNLNPMIQSNTSIHLQQIPAGNLGWNNNMMDANVPQAQFNMSVPSSSTHESSVMESDSWGIHVQQIPSNLGWNEDNNMMNSNVPLAQVNMSVLSSSTHESSVMESDSPSIHVQQIPSNLGWNEDNNMMNLNVPQAHFNMSVPSPSTLDTLMKYDSWGIHLQQIPGTSHWNAYEDSNMMNSNVPRAHLNMSVPSAPTLESSRMESDSRGIHVQQIPRNLGWNEDNNMMDSNVPRAHLNMSVPSAPTLESSRMESDSRGIHLQQIPGTSHWNEDSNMMNSNVPQATSAFEDEPTPEQIETWLSGHF